ncbi:MAG: hypothetical protein ACKVY0_20840 [Prosthecobacter sp.]|uniref:hypothetical protein n=1 Tax=Prosthecobacter sp. TaxID=1965333 RepID=UPI003903F51B
MNEPHWDHLIHGHLDDSLTESELAEFESLMLESASARRRFWELAEVHGLARESARLAWVQDEEEAALPEAPRTSMLKLAQKMDTMVTSQTRKWTNWLSWRPLAAAAAGIVLGMFCTSVVFAYAVPSLGKVITLLQESFESGPAPLVTGIPVEAGQWSGDYSEVVGEYRSVKPADGAKMLRFLRADYEGKPGRDGYVGDVFRIIDVRDAEYDVARGDACVSVESRFFSLPQDVRGRALCGITIHALDALPTPDERLELMEMGELAQAAAAGGTLRSGMSILATAVRNARLETTRDSWEVVRSELRLPPGTRFLLVHLSLLDPHGPQAPQPREFAGLFVDDVRVSLTHRPPLP